jgi:type VI secretion system protein ImpH
MASAHGREGIALSAALLAVPARFDFFQAVRLLRHVAAARARGNPGSQVAAGLDDESVRFRASPALSFAAADVQRLVPRKGRAGGSELLEMVVSFLGLTGPQGVLPPHYTTLLLRRVRDKDFALRDFLDLFNHRAIALFYAAWEKYRLPIAYEKGRAQQGGDRGAEDDPVAHCLYSLVGLGTDGLRGRLSVPDEAFLYYGGLFAQFPRSASALERMLQDYFGVSIEVTQAQGQWLVLEEDDRSRLPDAQHPEQRNGLLGVNLILGERVWDVQGKFRLRVGPLNYQTFCDYLPPGKGFRALGDLTRSYVGPEFDFDVAVLLCAAEVPWCRLDSAAPPRLGWDTWVRSREMGRDADDAVFDLSGP